MADDCYVALSFRVYSGNRSLSVGTWTAINPNLFLFRWWCGAGGNRAGGEEVDKKNEWCRTNKVSKIEKERKFEKERKQTGKKIIITDARSRQVHLTFTIRPVSFFT